MLPAIFRNRMLRKVLHGRFIANASAKLPLHWHMGRREDARGGLRSFAMSLARLRNRRTGFLNWTQRTVAALLLYISVSAVCVVATSNAMHDFMPLPRPGVASLGEQSDENFAFGDLDLRPTLRVLYRSDHKKIVTLIDGEAEDTLSFTLLIEQGFNLSRYRTKVACSHEDTLRPADVSIGPPMTLNQNHANFTVSATFERSVGVTKLSITFLKDDGSLYATVLCEYTVVGFSFFHMYPGNNTKTIVPPTGLVFDSYKDVLHTDLLVFYCKIQFSDGSSTFTKVSDISKRFSLSPMRIDTGGSKMIIPQRYNDCPTARGSVNGSGKMGLAPGCSYGFSGQYPEKNLQFGVRLKDYCSGAIVFKFRWPEMTAEIGDEEEYETSLTITVRGKSPPTVLSISPKGPFRRAGSELLTCTLGNVDSGDLFSFQLRNESLQVSRKPTEFEKDKTAVVSFLTPPGEGQDIPWDVFVTSKKTQISHKAIWSSDDARFNFSYRADELWIVAISPSIGTVDGGIPITLIGNFSTLYKSNSSDSCVFINDFGVPRRNVTLLTSEKIKFTLPPKNITRVRSSAVKVSVQLRGHQSNEIAFQYWENPCVVGMTQWTIGVMVSLILVVFIGTLVLCCCGTCILKRRSAKANGVEIDATVSHIDRDQFGRAMDAEADITPRTYVDRLVENFVPSSMLHVNSSASPEEGFVDDGGDEVVFSAVGLRKESSHDLECMD